MKAFDKAFTGICLMFEPGEDFELGGKPKSSCQLCAQKTQRRRDCGGICNCHDSDIFTDRNYKPAFSRIFMDRILTGQNPDWLIPFIIALSVLSALQIIVSLIQTVWSLRINGRLAVTGSSVFMWKVLRMPMEFFSQRMAGDIQQRQASNASIAGNLVNTFAPLVLQAAMMIFYLVVMIRYSLTLQS